MELTIKNFKGIELIEDIEIKPINVLSGVNSGGKTSFIQFFLLLKQSIETNNLETPLILNRPYTLLGSYKDMLYKKQFTNCFGFKITFNQVEVPRMTSYQIKRLTGKSLNKISLKIDFSNKSNRVYIQNYLITLETDDEITYWIEFRRDKGKKYFVNSNWLGFYNDDFRTEWNKVLKKSSKEVKEFNGNTIQLNKNTFYQGIVSFVGLFPQSIEIRDRPDYTQILEVSNIIKTFGREFNKLFQHISYIGPLRDEPHSYYLNDNDSDLSIGNKGENAAYILAKNSSKEINDYIMKSLEGYQGVQFLNEKSTLEKSVKYWICDVFKMARDIRINKYRNDTIYAIEITNNMGMKTPINHVGFGLSQILPIVVEGLRLKPGSTLILEQPEIHLHPRVQSLLFDFLYSLALAGKKIIVETHSDHLITRLRRRVAEDIKDTLSENINLIFFDDSNESRYRILRLSDMGALSYWPIGFFDQYEKDLKEIAKAQTRKRKFKRKALD